MKLSDSSCLPPEEIRKAPQAPWNGNFWVPLILAVLAFLYLADLFVGQRIFLARDAIIDGVPVQLFAASALKAGSLPLWCPFIGTGKPFLSDLTGLFYAPNWLFLAFNPALALKLFWLLHLLIAGLGAYFLVRQFYFGRLASLAGAIGFMLGTWVIVRMEFLPCLAASAWFPLPLALLVRFCRRQDVSVPWWRAVWMQRGLLALLSLVFAVQFATNYPEMLLYPLAGSVCFILLTAIADRNAQSVSARILFFGSAGVLALLVVMPQLLPQWEFLGFSERAQNFDERFGMASVSISHYLAGLFPFIDGRPGYPDLFWEKGAYEYWAGAFYMGALAVFAAPFSLLLLTGRQGARARFQRLAVLLGLCLLVLGLLLAAGDNTPVYGWLYYHVPGMNRFRFPSKFLVLVVIGTLLLSTAGLDALLSRRVDISRQMFRAALAVIACEALVLILCVAEVAYAAVHPQSLRVFFDAPSGIPSSRFIELIPQLFMDVAFIAGAFALIAALVFLRKRLPYWIPVFALPAFVFANMLAVSRQIYPVAPDGVLNASVDMAGQPHVNDPQYRTYSPFACDQQYLYGNADAGLYQWAGKAGVGSIWLRGGVNQLWQGGAKLDKYNRLITLMTGTSHADVAGAVADMLGMRWMLNGADWQNIFWNHGSRKIVADERPGALPRLRLVSDWQSVGSDTEVFQKFSQGLIDPHAPMVEPLALENGRAGKLDVPKSDAVQGDGSLSAIRYGLNSLSVKTNAMRQKLLVMGDTWYPGWRATIDGKEAPIFLVNYMFRGIFVPAGSHEVRMDYFPNGFSTGCLVSLMAIPITGCLLTGRRRAAAKAAEGNRTRPAWIASLLSLPDGISAMIKPAVSSRKSKETSSTMKSATSGGGKPPVETIPATTHAFWLGLLFLLVILTIGSSLFRDDVVLSNSSADIAHHFLSFRVFGFGELAHGHLPLWNPYSYGGAPFLGQIESALLYPPNWIFTFLPVPTALNWSIALHVFLLGAGMYCWGIFRKLLPAAAFLSGVAAMMGGSFFLHIYGGHLSNICVMAWAPLVFLGIDAWIGRRHAGWIFLSAGAAALQIYAGHPQYVYYTAIVAGLYSLVSLVGAERPAVVALGLTAIYPLAVLFAAAQMFPALALASESVRSGGMSYESASVFSLPPENFLTGIAPWFFGNMRSVPYWGRCYLWEMEIYPGLGVLALACNALISLKNGQRIRWVIMLAITVLLALGMHTPLYGILYHVLPGFSGFRGTSKFIFFAGLFVALLAGMGMDHWLRGRKFSLPVALVWFVAGCLTGAAGLWLSDPSAPASAWWLSAWQAIARSGESYFIFEPLKPALMDAAKTLSIHSLEAAGAGLVAFALIALAGRRWSRTAWVFGLLAVVELFVFARGSVTTFGPDQVRPFEDVLLKQKGDFRVLNLVNAEASMLVRSENLWGYDPSVLKRYAEFIAFTQGSNPDEAGQNQDFSRNSRLLALLRCEFEFAQYKDGVRMVPVQQPFPRFFLVTGYKVVKGRDAIFAALGNSSFDLRNEVILEKEPVPQPDEEAGLPHYQINVLDASTDQWTLEITTDRSAILIVPDSYSRDWHATALPGSVQTNYELIPGDYAIRAIPLAAGHHLLRVAYTPSGFYAGVFLSISSLAAALALFLVPAFRRRLALTRKARLENPLTWFAASP